MRRNTAQDAIADGYLSLLKRSSTERITVSAIIKESKVSRQTFYYHFECIDDLIEYVIMRMVDEVISSVSYDADLKTNMKALMDRINDDMPIVKATHDGNSREINRVLFLKGMKKIIRGYLDKSPAYKHKLSVKDVDLAVDVYAYGIQGLVEEAVNEDRLLDSEQIADFLDRVWTGKLPMMRTS